MMNSTLKIIILSHWSLKQDFLRYFNSYLLKGKHSKVQKELRYNWIPPSVSHDTLHRAVLSLEEISGRKKKQKTN